MSEKTHEHLVVTGSPDAGLCARWQEFLRNAPFATHYVTPDFFIDPFAGRGEKFAILAVDSERIDAVLTGVKVNNKVVAGMAVRPQTVFRESADKVSAADALVRGLASHAAESDELITFHSWELIDGLSPFGYTHEAATGADRVVMLDLSKGPDALFKNFSERRRTDLRKTIKQCKLEVKLLETEAELAELYEIHKDWNERKGNTPDEREAFSAMLNSRHRATFIAIHEGRIVAGTYLRFAEGGVVEYAANNSLAEFQKLRPNELLGWRAIEWACVNGFTKFSLGASHPFLARFGGELFSSHRYQLDRTFFKRHVMRERAMRLAVRTYQSLPDPLRKRIKSAAARV
ncbi:MAG: GNAT family N-acetyltransferase [Pyrinomonadaceae bacterium]